MALDDSDHLRYYYENVNRLECAIKASELYRLERQAELTKMLEESPRTAVRDYLRSVPFECGIGGYTKTGTDHSTHMLNLNTGTPHSSHSTSQHPQQPAGTWNPRLAGFHEPTLGTFCNSGNCTYPSVASRGIPVDKLTLAHKTLYTKTTELFKEMQSVRKVEVKTRCNRETQTDAISHSHSPTVVPLGTSNSTNTHANQGENIEKSTAVASRYSKTPTSLGNGDCPFCFHCAQLRLGSERASTGLDTSHNKPHQKPAAKVETKHTANRKVVHRIAENHVNANTTALHPAHPVLKDSSQGVIDDVSEHVNSEPGIVQPQSAVYYSNSHKTSEQLARSVTYHNASSQQIRRVAGSDGNDINNHDDKPDRVTSVQPSGDAVMEDVDVARGEVREPSPSPLGEVDAMVSEGEILEGDQQHVDTVVNGDAAGEWRSDEMEGEEEESIVETTSASDITHDLEDGEGEEGGDGDVVEIDDFEDYEDVLRRQQRGDVALNLSGGDVVGEVGEVTAPAKGPTEVSVSEMLQELTVLLGCVETLSGEMSGYTDVYTGELADDELCRSVKDELFASEDASRLRLEDVSRVAMSQLRAVVSELAEQSLFSSDLLNTSYDSAPEDVVRNDVMNDPERLRCWDIISNHLGYMKRHDIMDMMTLITLLTPLLLSPQANPAQLTSCENLLINEFAIVVDASDNGGKETTEDADSGSSDSISRHIAAAQRKALGDVVDTTPVAESHEDQQKLESTSSVDDAGDSNFYDSYVEEDGDDNRAEPEKFTPPIAELSVKAATGVWLDPSPTDTQDSADLLEEKMLRELGETDEEDSSASELGKSADNQRKTSLNNSGSKWAPVTLQAVNDESAEQRASFKQMGSGDDGGKQSNKAPAKKHFYLDNAKSKVGLPAAGKVMEQNTSLVPQARKGKPKAKGKKPIWLASSSSDEDAVGGIGLQFDGKPNAPIRQHSKQRGGSEIDEF